MQVRHCSAFGTRTGTPTRASCTSTLGTVGGSCRSSLRASLRSARAKYYELILERETPENAMPSTTEHDAERVGI
jgi:hypothetical protein